MVFVLIYSNIFAQQSEWTQFYNSNIASCLAEYKGKIWIGTQGAGLISIDKTDGSIEYFNSANSVLSNNMANDIVAGKDGNLWIGSYYGGITKFNGEDWEHFSADDVGCESLNSVLSLASDSDGNLWIGAYNGLVKYDGNEWTYYDESYMGAPHENIRAIAFDNMGNKLLACEGLLGVYNDSSWTYYDIYNGSFGNSINSIAVSENNTIWLGTIEGLISFDGSDWNRYHTANSGIPDNKIYHVSIAANGDKLISTFSKGIAVYDDSNWTLINSSNSDLPSDYVRFIESNQDTLWIATLLGTAKYDHVDWTIYEHNYSEITSNNINCMTTDNDGNVWVGANGGAFRYKDSQWNIFNTLNSELPHYNVNSISAGKDGSVWLGTNGGAARIKEGNWKVYTTENSLLPSNQVYSVYVDTYGFIWFGTAGRTAALIEEQWTIFDESVNSSSISTVLDIAEDGENKLWFSIYFNGVASYNRLAWKFFDSQNSGILSDFVNDINLAPGGAIWTAVGGESMQGGVSVTYNNGINWVNYTTSNSGLVSDFITLVVPDNSGNVWIGSADKSLIKYDGVSWVNFTPENSGLPEKNITSVTIDSTGRVWVGTKNCGIAVFSENSTGITSSKNTDPSFYLGENYPNPFNPSTTINFSIPVSSEVTLDVFNTTGEKIKVIAKSKQYQAGEHKIVIDLNGQSSGLYIYRIRAHGADGREFSSAGKMILLK